ncbi:Molybdopterin synthase catalytic subunit [Tulasnella sp. 403]|nr:Molybdopterin synthase catalytic subunit [Tulasnella sp. 403]
MARRKVVRLEYEAYTKLAIKTLAEILQQSRQLTDERGPGDTLEDITQGAERLIRCAVHHRLGNVPVGEASIIIAVSSPHRKVAFKACEYILEEVKLKAQIWKREWYEGEQVNEAHWKENFPRCL